MSPSLATVRAGRGHRYAHAYMNESTTGCLSVFVYFKCLLGFMAGWIKGRTGRGDRKTEREREKLSPLDVWKYYAPIKWLLMSLESIYPGVPTR